MGQILQCGARADVRRFLVASGEARARQRVAVGEERADRGGAIGGDRAASRPREEVRAQREALAGQARPPILNANGMPARPGAVTIFVPKLGATERWDEWMWRQLRDGGGLRRYLELEKRMAAARLRAVRRKMDGFEQNNKSDLRLKAALPAREYFRWKAEDPHFWEDDSNLRSWRRDNPDAFVRV